MFPAASRAVTVRRLAPAWRTIPLAVQLVVPVAVPLPPRVFAHVTWVAPEADPPRLRDERLVAEVGEAGGGREGTPGGAGGAAGGGGPGGAVCAAGARAGAAGTVE